MVTYYCNAIRENGFPCRRIAPCKYHQNKYKRKRVKPNYKKYLRVIPEIEYESVSEPENEDVGNNASDEVKEVQTDIDYVENDVDDFRDLNDCVYELIIWFVFMILCLLLMIFLFSINKTYPICRVIVPMEEICDITI